VKELGFVAWHTHSNYGDSYPDEPKYRPLFAKAAELGIYVYLHPQLPNIKRLLDLGFTFAGPGVGFTVDTTITILRMIATGLFDEIPNLKVVLGHLGEGIPFLLDRIDNRMNFLPNPKLSNKQLPSYYFKNNIMVTTSGNMSPEAFQCTKDVLGIDRILFGSDHPFESAVDMVKFVDNLVLTDEERALLYYKNAAKLNVF
jgi:predicted TIM-barrel fold metal-dependent hydrolase